jgi:hypothetical protein
VRVYPPRTIALVAACVAVAAGVVVACGREPGSALAGDTARVRVAVDGGGDDPLAYARAHTAVANREAGVPPPCYTATAGESNPCWVCHTTSIGPNLRDDVDLQREYAFSDVAKENHWTNLFADRRAAIAAISDAEILAWVRTDNYAPLRAALAGRADWDGFRIDLDLAAGFDAAGFARDGSGWRAVRYQPFPGMFWPGSGSTDDVYVRLPAAFRVDATGAPSLAVYRANLAVLEAAVAGVVDDTLRIDRAVEMIDERLLGADVDGNGWLGIAERITALPPRYAGGAAGVPVVALMLPAGTELLHTVRYLDPDRPDLVAARLKELRWMKKVEDTDAWSTMRAYEREHDEKDEGRTPRYRGDVERGLVSAFGWQLQGFVEDARGALRLQTEEEHRFCMGCHGGIGVTVDSTFSLARKVPGADGWRPQDLRGLRDRPQIGHPDGELLTYLRRVGSVDETRSNDEARAKLAPGGVVDAALVRRAAPGGDLDLLDLLAPSRARALALDKAYLAVVREQSFTRGRDAMLAPATRVQLRIDAVETGLPAAGRFHADGRLHLRWTE